MADYLEYAPSTEETRRAHATELAIEFVRTGHARPGSGLIEIATAIESYLKDGVYDGNA
jgi:hypothetical protein